MPPIHILIKPASSLCNLRCKYCFYADVAENRAVKSYGIMEESTLELLVKRVFDYADGYATFSFQGGEPTLAGLSFYQKLLTFQKQYNVQRIPVQNAIQTNGYVIDEAWATFLAEHHFLVGLSMDGTRELHDGMRLDAAGKGTYGRVKRAAELFDRYGVEYNILCVVNNLVARHPKQVYQALKGYRYLQFIPCLDGLDGARKAFSLDPRRYADFLIGTFDEYYRDFMSGNYVSVRNFDNYVGMLLGRPPESCAQRGVCTCYCVVEGDGSVYPCDFYVLDEWKLGNLREDSISAMLQNEKAMDFMRMSHRLPRECGACPHYALCRGGCRREREPLGDPALAKNFLCESYRLFFERCTEKMRSMAARL
ncbi:MAG: anaerobic sulfatase maturase [Clostridia bacterium]|nr:anaerobic sulfatase maturase [Clostridia bacterium]